MLQDIVLITPISTIMVITLAQQCDLPPIQREWHYIDRQADHEAVDQMLPPVL